jgi:hypothetical protein
MDCSQPITGAICSQFANLRLLQGPHLKVIHRLKLCPEGLITTHHEFPDFLLVNMAHA